MVATIVDVLVFAHGPQFLNDLNSAWDTTSPLYRTEISVEASGQCGCSAAGVLAHY